MSWWQGRDRRRAVAWIALLSVALLIPLTVAGCGQAQPKSIELGAVLPLSGKFQAAGQYFKQGYEMAIDEVNQAGGIEINGKKLPVNLTVLDDGSDPTTSRSLVEKLITQNHVHALLGGYDTVLVEAQEGVPDQYKIPYVEGGGAASAIFQKGYKYIFGTLATVYDMGKITMEFLQAQIDQGKLPKPLTIAVVWENTDHGKDYDAAVKDAAAAHPDYFKIVFDSPFDLNGSDFTSLLTQVKASGADAFLSDAHLPDFITMHTQYTQMKMYNKFVSYGARGPDQKGRQALGSAADYLVSALWWTPALSNPQSQAFAQAYKAKYNQTADWFQAEAYETARALLRAIQNAGSLDGTKIRDALVQLDMKDSILPGGELKFGPNGQSEVPYVMVQNLPNNQVQVVWPTNLPEAKPAILPMPTPGGK